MYTLTGVSKTFRKGHQTIPAVQDVSLAISDGEWLTIQGRTGHGKTTLLQLLGGLDRPDSGTVEFGDQDLARLRESQLTRVRARSIGFIFQTFNLVPTLSAADNVEAALIPLRLGRRDRRRQVTGGAGVRRTGRPGAAPARRAVRGPAAAGGDRPFAGQGPEGAAGRRADRQPGRRHPR